MSASTPRGTRAGWWNATGLEGQSHIWREGTAGPGTARGKCLACQRQAPAAQGAAGRGWVRGGSRGHGAQAGGGGGHQDSQQLAQKAERIELPRRDTESGFDGDGEARQGVWATLALRSWSGINHCVPGCGTLGYRGCRCQSGGFSVGVAGPGLSEWPSPTQQSPDARPSPGLRQASERAGAWLGTGQRLASAP